MDNTAVLNSSDGNMGAALAGLIVSLGVVVIVLSLIVGILWYILQSLGFYRLAKNRKIKPAWIAWIPICQNYLLGELIGNEVWGLGYANWILPGVPAVLSLITSVSNNLPDFLSIILLIISVVFYVYLMTALYKLYKIYSTKSTLLLVLSIVFPFLMAIFVFAIRNNKPNIVIE